MWSGVSEPALHPFARLTPDQVLDARVRRKGAQFLDLGQIGAQRPFAIDVLSGLERGHHRLVVRGHPHHDRRRVDGWRSRERIEIVERFPSAMRSEEHTSELQSHSLSRMPSSA